MGEGAKAEGPFFAMKPSYNWAHLLLSQVDPSLVPAVTAGYQRVPGYRKMSQCGTMGSPGESEGLRGG